MRDAVRRAARELAGAGIRLEIPRYLQPSLKALEEVSYNLKKKNPDMRRNIKFDNGELDLVLDFCLNPSADPTWRSLQPAGAKAVKAKLSTSGAATKGEVDEDELNSMLGMS